MILNEETIAEDAEREEKCNQYRQDVQAAWETYQETGKYITDEETINWLESWGSEHEKDAPMS